MQGLKGCLLCPMGGGGTVSTTVKPSVCASGMSSATSFSTSSLPPLPPWVVVPSSVLALESVGSRKCGMRVEWDIYSPQVDKLTFLIDMKRDLLLFHLLSYTWLFCDSLDYSLPGSSVHGISQVRMLESVSVFRGSSQSREFTETEDDHDAGDESKSLTYHLLAYLLILITPIL